MHRLQHHRRHHRLDAVQHARHPGHAAKSHINPTQAHQNEQRGQHKQHPRHHTAPGAVHQPTNVSGQLLRLGAGQQHAVVQRVQKAFFRNPAFLLHQLAVHDGNLPGRTTKADETQLQPKFKRVKKRDGRPARWGGGGGGRGVRHSHGGGSKNQALLCGDAVTLARASARFFRATIFNSRHGPVPTTL